MSIPRPLAVLRAIDSTVKALAENLPTTLQSYEVLEPGMPLPAPDRYALALSSEAMEEALSNAHVACFVFQSAPSETRQIISGSALEQSQVQSTFIEVRIAYNHRLTIPYTPGTLGLQLTSQDILARRGYYYVAAVMDIVYRHLCCSSAGAVSDVLAVDSDFAGAIFQTVNQQYHGLASIVFELRQDTLVPYCED